MFRFVILSAVFFAAAVSSGLSYAQTPSLGTRSSTFGDCNVTAASVPSECEGDAMFAKNCTCLVIQNACGFPVSAFYKLSTEAKPRSANISGNSSERRCTTSRATSIQYLNWKRSP